VAPELSTDSDTELARQTQAGSDAAFEELVRRYEHRVHAFVAQFCRNAADAREVTQETFVKASQSMKQFDARREFAPWLFTIARRKCIDRHRAAPPAMEDSSPERPDENDPAESLARHEDQQQLWQIARRCLPEIQFQALWLRYAEDMDVPQIAQVLAKTRVHVKVLLFRARQILGGKLNHGRTLAQAIPESSSRPHKWNSPQPAALQTAPHISSVKIL